MKIRLPTIILLASLSICTNLAAQVVSIFNSMKESRGYSFEIIFYNDTAARFSYDSRDIAGGYSFPVKFSATNDSTICFTHPFPDTLWSRNIEYFSDKSDTVTISVSRYTIDSDDIWSMPTYDLVSLDGVKFDTLDMYEEFPIGNIQDIPDSIWVNSDWIKIDKKKVNSHIAIVETTIHPPEEHDYEGFPLYFDTLVLRKSKGSWKVLITEELEKFDLSLFQQIR